MYDREVHQDGGPLVIGPVARNDGNGVNYIHDGVSHRRYIVSSPS